uniref:Uncharacterized protein n=1 Tax=Marseillevirus LCMAC201 TaxID=2506605 RepID=A0A481YWW0_9VIRU|nr:MAG: hypothetical protein LCMAC201_02770 [Marseillevirus LCMAC201]
MIDEDQLDAHIRQRIDDNWELVVKLYSLSQWLGTHHRCGDCTVPDCCESCYSGDTECDMENDISDTVVQLFGNYNEGNTSPNSSSIADLAVRHYDTPSKIQLYLSPSPFSAVKDPMSPTVIRNKDTHDWIISGTKFVVRSSKIKVVIGKLHDDEIVILSQADITECKTNGWKVDT